MTTIAKQTLLLDVRKSLESSGAPDAKLEAALVKILAAFDCPVGTIHTLDPKSGLLALRARRGIPDIILDKVKLIPIGKGMAGIAAERKQPVQVCNLQTDSSGVAKPGAKETKMEGTITAPMLKHGELRGTLGVAKPIPYEFNEEETALLMELGALIADLAT